MEVGAVARVGSGEALPAAALEDLLRSAVCTMAAQTVAAAGVALAQLLLVSQSWFGEIGAITDNEGVEERFNMAVVVGNKNHATPEIKDDGETDDDEDDDDDDDEFLDSYELPVQRRTHPRSGHRNLWGENLLGLQEDDDVDDEFMDNDEVPVLQRRRRFVRSRNYS
uniref:Uncharacterized protein n=1 Tax=Anthurium amnicola TaxID=1678845 RepID=A0A1D1YME3_9ARAE